MTAELRLPEPIRREDEVALSPEGRYACVQTERAVYFLRLVQRRAQDRP